MSSMNMNMNNSMMHNMTHTNGTAMNNSTMAGMGTGMSGMGTGMTGTGKGMTGMGSGMCGGMGDMGGMMSMYFHAGIEEYILFKQLHTTSKPELAWACLAVFLAATLYEVLKFMREELQRSHNVRVAQVLLHGSQEEKNVALSTSRRVFSRTHVFQTLLHAVQVFLSYLLMLVFMTYNAYLCTSLVVGATLGYFCTGWRRTQVTDQNEHCH